MDKRTLISLLIVLILFTILQVYVFKPSTPPAEGEQVQDSLTKNVRDTISTPVAIPATIAKWDSLASHPDSIKTLTLENENITVKFSSLGAGISSLSLKKYLWADKPVPVDLVPEQGRLAGISLLGLNVNQNKDLKPLNWYYAQLDSSVVFWLGDEANPLVKKVYSLDDKYGILMDVVVSSSYPVYGIEYDYSDGIADTEKIKSNLKDTDYKLLLFYENSLQKYSLSKVRKKQPQGQISAFKWAALRTKYFTIAINETGNPLTSNYFARVSPTTGNPAIVLNSYDRSPSQNWEQHFLIYAGPADYNLLKSYKDTKMELIPERGPGWLRWLSNPIAWLLQFLHSFIPNYGIVIIIFSILLKIILQPLTNKSTKANLKMQSIQPQVQELQKKYKNDPQRMQKELSKLYKEAGANPFSGCFPLLLQMPIFIALYNVLRYTMDMRNARFFGWLNDLSEPDPYWILPLIMAGFMVLQSLMSQPSKETLTKMDEQQRAMQKSTKMMTWLMPIIMFFIFKSLPSGLVLYYTVFNILSVIQMYYMKKNMKKKELSK